MLPPVLTAADRLASVRLRVVDACARAGRDGAEVSVVAVSKGFGADAVAALRAAGQRDFGENRAQELRSKEAELRSKGAELRGEQAESRSQEAGSGGGEAAVRWHFVGRLQRNKVRDVVGLADVVHSVDRVELAEVLAARAVRVGRRMRVYAQVNAGADPAKAGCAPAEAPRLVARLAELEGLDCEGLMTVPPAGVDPRPVFERLRLLRDQIAGDHPTVRGLSMGMSADFEAAVAEGATVVRIGEALFGPRPAADRSRHDDSRAAAGAAAPPGPA